MKSCVCKPEQKAFAGHSFLPVLAVFTLQVQKKPQQCFYTVLSEGPNIEKEVVQNCEF